MKLKVTYKKHPKNKGLYAVGHPYSDVDIKLNGKIIGVISAPNWQSSGWFPRFQVLKKELMEDGNPNCKWRWAHFNSQDTLELAKEWVENNIEAFVKKYEFYQHTE